jgi:pyridoxamine 5'-phosphate oxidase
MSAMSQTMERPAWLTSGDFMTADDPFALLAAWLEEATKTEPVDPNAMAVATVDADGLPNVRMVLLKGFDERGLVFYTNTDSQKGRELGSNPKAALVFYWKSLGRQVRLRGNVELVEDAEADAYFATRPRLAQIGAWASKQSSSLESRHAFEKAVALYTAKFHVGTIERPPNWGGYRVVPLIIEFWCARPFRLHDRLEFRRTDPAATWRRTLLYP